MSIATRTEAQSPALHAADSHDLIRVHGARVNNLKDVSVELPKRRLTVFTGVSGSGKSSLVFATIAAESQRLINETYSAFVQGFMPTLARPDVDVLEGLTTAIIVDQERIGANPRSTVGTATDANAHAAHPFQPPWAAAHRDAQRRSPSTSRLGRERGHEDRPRRPQRRRVVREAVYQGGMCPRCEGMGPSTTSTSRPFYDECKSLSTRAQLSSGYSMDGWYGRIFTGAGLRPWTSRSRVSPTQQRELLYGEPEEIKVEGVNLTYEGRPGQDPEVDARQGRRGDAAAHPRLRGARGHVPDLS